MKNTRLIYWVLIVLFIISCNKKNDKITIEDYNNAVSYLNSNLYNKRVFNLYTTANWFKDNSGFWFIEYGKNKKEFKRVNFQDNKITSLLIMINW